MAAGKGGGGEKATEMKTKESEDEERAKRHGERDGK